MDTSFTNRCRCCAGVQKRSEKMISLFEENLTKMFTYCTALEIASNDNLPSHICQDCFGLLSNFNNFRRKCIISDTYFRGQIATSSIKFELELVDLIDIKCEEDEPNHDFESKFFETDCKGTNDTKYVPDTIIVQSLSLSTDIPYTFDETKFICDHCDKSFDNKRNMRRHMTKHTKGTDIPNPILDSNTFDETKFICDHCGKVFDNKGNMRRHMTKHTKGTSKEPVVCIVEGCSKVFATQLLMSTHRRKKHKILIRSNIKFQCQQCPKWFAVEHKLGAHIRRVHEGLKPYKCGHCEEEFCKYRTYDTHMKFRHNTAKYEKFQCSYEGCDKEYRVKNSLKCHIDRVHFDIKNTKDQKLICDQCGRSFKNGYTLRKHCYTHTGLSPFLCKICPKRFDTNYKLKVHTMRHLDDRPFKCPTCGARKTTNKELQAHLNFHTKAISYPCKECDRIFTSYAARDRHVRIHHRNHKPYICPHCQKAFSKAETMKNHVMTHTGEKPFACSICGHRFIQAVAMRKHMKVHTKASN